MSDDRDTEEFVISRSFDAPLETVWQAHTNVDCLRQWWGPKGFTMFSATMSLRPGGMLHFGMQSPDGHKMWGKFVYREIIVPERLVLLAAFSDIRGGTTRHPWSANWPLEMLNTLTFSAEDGRTLITIQCEPYHAADDERKTFEAGRECMRMGFTGTLDQLAAYLDAKRQPDQTDCRRRAA